MKAIEILTAIVADYCKRFPHLYNCRFIEVPCNELQTEEWWFEELGACPPAPIPEGKYLLAARVGEDLAYAISSQLSPDVEIESGDDFINLYKIDE